MPVKRRAGQDELMQIDGETDAYRLAVATTIKRLRLAADLSMNRLGESAGLSQPMIGLIERGIHTPTVSTLFRIARSLGTTPAKLLAEVEAPETKSVRKKSDRPAASKRTPARAKVSKNKKRPEPL